MSAQTGISWADSTFNPWIGCNAISPACNNCYAEAFAKRVGRNFATRTRTSATNWKLPERWNREPYCECASCGLRSNKPMRAQCLGPERSSHNWQPARRRVFSLSLGDWLDNEVPIEWLVDLLDLIRRTPNLDWLVLTKRIGNWRPRLEAAASATVGTGALNQWISQWLFARTPPPHVWIGATVINQDEADRDVPKLLMVPAAVRFLSIEPMLGPIEIRNGRANRWSIPTRTDSAGRGIEWTDPGERYIPVDWVICGGESGPHARPMHPDWVRSLRDQAQAAGVAFHFKQWGEYAPDGHPEHDRPYLVDASGFRPIERKTWAAPMLDRSSQWVAYRVGKKAAGRLLDGRTWDEFPKGAA